MSKSYKLLLLSMGHLFVDLCSVYLIFSFQEVTNLTSIAYLFILYNLVAFGLQPIVGYFADQYNLYTKYIVIGLGLALLMVLFPFEMNIVVIIATIGNVLYHVGGGVLAANLYPDKATPLGIFVAPGAIGVFLGIFAGMWFPFEVSSFILLPAVMIWILLIVVISTEPFKQVTNKVPKQLGIITLLLLIIIFIRGFIGFNTPFPWKSDVYLRFALVLGVFTGKFLGGILGDKFGYFKVGAAGLLLSIPFFFFSTIPFMGIIGAFLFNFTMAITLYLIIYSFGKYQGFAFGLTTLALFIAYLPFAVDLKITNDIVVHVINIALPIVATYLLYRVTRIYQSYKEEII